MTTLIYALLIALNFISSPAEFDQLSPQEQEQMMGVITEEVIL